MTLPRRTLFALPALLAAPAARAQAEWPSRPIRLIVPFPPGGIADVLGRPVAARIQASFGQPVVVENLAGAGGNIGADLVAKAAPDGYTLLLGSLGTLAANAFLYERMPFDAATAFAPIALIATTPMVVCVNAQRPWRTLEALIAAARAAPGRITAGSAGAGSALHIALAMFNRAANVEVTHVPYRGAAPAVTDLVAGQIDMIIDTVANIGAQLAAGTVRALATAEPRRVPQLPDVPSAAEAGLPGFDIAGWFGLAAPAGTPGAIVARLAAATEAAMADPEAGGRLVAQGVVAGSGGPAGFAAFLEAERTKLGGIIRAANIRAE
jgi:tripartite-type tricarboxylate transporter receptor subunit TctC